MKKFYTHCSTNKKGKKKFITKNILKVSMY